MCGVDRNKNRDVDHSTPDDTFDRITTSWSVGNFCVRGTQLAAARMYVVTKGGNENLITSLPPCDSNPRGCVNDLALTLDLTSATRVSPQCQVGRYDPFFIVGPPIQE